MDEKYISYIENYLTRHEWDKDDIDREIRKIARMRSTLRLTNLQLYETIENAVSEFCIDNDILDDDIFNGSYLEGDNNSCDPEEIINYLFED